MTTTPPRGPFLGIDIGATKVLVGLVAPDGGLLAHSDRVVHSNEGLDEVLARVREGVGRVRAQVAAAPTAAGVAVAAQVDTTSGAVLYAPNLRWRDIPLGPRLAKELGLPTVVENDVRAALWGEWQVGAGRGEQNLLGLFVGTGVGGALIADGRPVRGAGEAAGEIGHSTLVAGGRACHCPNRGCLEAYIGGWAIAERAREAVARDPRAGKPLLARVRDPSEITAADVAAAARAGDPLARSVADETAAYVASAAVGLVNAFNPGLLVLGGGLLEHWPELTEGVELAVRERCQPPAARSVRVVRAALGHHAAVVGAALLAGRSAPED